jgi:uncharacterized protein (DUF1684 family)
MRAPGSPRLGLALLSATLACHATPSAAPNPDDPRPAELEADALDRARAFQRDYEDELRADDRSFLTVVDAHYLAPGRELGLALVDGAWIEHEPASVAFAVDEGGVSITGATPERVTERARIPVGDDGRFAFTVSQQEHDWRVLVHDRDAELRASFPGIDWYPIDPARIVDARFEPRSPREPTTLQTSRGVTKTLYAAGDAEFELDGQALTLVVFAYEPEPRADEPLLIPFRDATTGHGSYAAGRYLEPTLPDDARLRLDFNRATNPLCAYSEHYNCPVPPRFNTLPVAIEAGARTPHP